MWPSVSSLCDCHFLNTFLVYGNDRHKSAVHIDSTVKNILHRKVCENTRLTVLKDKSKKTSIPVYHPSLWKIFVRWRNKGRLVMNRLRVSCTEIFSFSLIFPVCRLDHLILPLVIPPGCDVSELTNSERCWIIQWTKQLKNRETKRKRGAKACYFMEFLVFIYVKKLGKFLLFDNCLSMITGTLWSVHRFFNYQACVNC